jgi:ATP-dependent RNA helicase DDX23/PRP28
MPTFVQMDSVLLRLRGRDVVGVSQMGSSKTAAFVLPLLSYITCMPPIVKEADAAV